MTTQETKGKEYWIWFNQGSPRVLVENDFIDCANPDFKSQCTHVLEATPKVKAAEDLFNALDRINRWLKRNNHNPLCHDEIEAALSKARGEPDISEQSEGQRCPGPGEE
jgi:hypothetical protein